MSLNVLFVDTNGNPLSLQLTRDMKFSEAIKIYKLNRKSDISYSQITFIFNSTVISQNCDKSLSELGIENMSKIFVTSNLYFNPFNLANIQPIMHPSYWNNLSPKIEMFNGHQSNCLSVKNIIEENEITVMFNYAKGDKPESALILRKNMKFSEVASKIYNEMHMDEEKDELKFYFNSQITDFNKTLDEIGIENGSKIIVLHCPKICGVGLSIKSILENKDNKDKMSGKKINVSFKFMNDEPINTSLKNDMMFAEVAMQFCEQYGALTSKKIETDKVKFIYNGKAIKSYSYKTLEELGISNNARLLVIISETIKDEGSNEQNIIEKEKKLNNILSEESKKKYLKKEEKINIIKKYDLNIIYYDENLKNPENSDNCSFFDMNINGTFYGCHYFDLFKIVCEKIKNTKKEFILISSGSCSKKVFEHCSNIEEIREYYIYCFDVDKYKPLMDKYPKLKGIYDIFEKLKEKLYSIKPMKMDFISSSNLIFFEDYSRLYIKLHYEFIRKYLLFKILKSHNYNESQFLALVEEKRPNFIDLAKQLFPKTKETIDFFKANINEKEEIINEVFKTDENILNDNVQTYIKNYTAETFYYRYLNKFLRIGNFEAFRILSSHVAKFVYKLYEFREKKILKENPNKLYRKMLLNPEDVQIYKKSVGKVICYPAFTSTSLNTNFTPNSDNDFVQLVILDIEPNNCKSTISISEYSDYKNEEEYLFLPFSFFKIKKVKLCEGNEENPHIIYLKALDSEKPIEQILADFMDNETDSLNPEGLDFLILENNDEKISINPIYYSNKIKMNNQVDMKEEKKEEIIEKKKNNSYCLIY